MKSENMNFGEALEYLKSGTGADNFAVTMKDWYGSKASPIIKLQVPDKHSKMSKPYLYMEKNDVNNSVVRFPVDLSCESLLSENWTIVDA